MALEQARAYLEIWGCADQIIELEHSSATVVLAAEALGTEAARIAKTLAFWVDGKPVLIVTAGDQKIDNAKFKAFFHVKAKMLGQAEVDVQIGHPVGGVCPFGIQPGIPVYLDVSLQRFETVFPACGSGNSAIELTPERLFEIAQAETWIDVCK